MTRRMPPPAAVSALLAVRDRLARLYRGIVPPSVRVLEGSFGLIETKALGAAAELGVADALADGPRTATELAEALPADTDALARLLRLLVSLGYFRRVRGERWANNAASEYLRRDHPDSLRDWARFMGADWTGSIWNELPATVRTGRSGTEMAFGLPFFELMEDRPEAGALFDAAMESSSRFTAPMFAAGFDFSDVRRVCDVGGGTGALLATVLAAHPHLTGVLFDLPRVVADAGPVLAPHGVADRVEVVGGDFFTEVPAGCDCYVMQSIVHDWDDDACVQILTATRDAMPAGARVLLLEAIMPTSDVLHPARYADLMMLVLTARGRERTRSEYEQLAARAGLRVSRVVNVVTRDVLELVRA